MRIPVRATSKVSGRVVDGSFTPRQLLYFYGEPELIDKLTMCDCQTIGETNVIECNCDEEWYDYELLIGEEVN